MVFPWLSQYLMMSLLKNGMKQLLTTSMLILLTRWKLLKLNKMT